MSIKTFVFLLIVITILALILNYFGSYGVFFAGIIGVMLVSYHKDAEKNTQTMQPLDSEVPVAWIPAPRNMENELKKLDNVKRNFGLTALVFLYAVFLIVWGSLIFEGRGIDGFLDIFQYMFGH